MRSRSAARRKRLSLSAANLKLLQDAGELVEELLQKPEYVKICSAYGAGFFYVPGTDTCIKIGGWVRAEYTYHTGTGDQPFHSGTPGRNTRIDSNEYNMRARWTTSIDGRTQTEYGTLRAYSRAGFQTSTGETAQGKIYTERGLIQFAGFTLGKSQSYFDFFGGKFCYGCIFLGNSSTTDFDGNAARRLHGNVRQRVHGDDLVGRQLHAPQRRLGRLRQRHQRARDRCDAWPRCSPGLLQRGRGSVGRHCGGRHSGHRRIVARCQAWGSARSPAPCTSSVLATTATTRPARRDRRWREQRLLVAERRIRLGGDGGYRRQPAVGEGDKFWIEATLAHGQAPTQVGSVSQLVRSTR